MELPLAGEMASATPVLVAMGAIFTLGVVLFLAAGLFEGWDEAKSFGRFFLMGFSGVSFFVTSISPWMDESPAVVRGERLEAAFKEAFPQVTPVGDVRLTRNNDVRFFEVEIKGEVQLCALVQQGDKLEAKLSCLYDVEVPGE